MAGAEVDIGDVEQRGAAAYGKENFDPQVQVGRRSLQQGLGAFQSGCFAADEVVKDSTEEVELQRQRFAFEERIRRKGGKGDIVQVWCDYVRWAADQKLGQSEEHALLRRACCSLAGDLRCKDDVRHLRLWVRHANTLPRPQEVFGFLEQQGIGLQHALLYEAWAASLELQRDFAEAEAVYHRGLERRAEPVGRLEGRLADFQQRMRKRAARRKAQPPKEEVEEPLQAEAHFIPAPEPASELPAGAGEGLPWRRREASCVGGQVADLPAAPRHGSPPRRAAEEAPEPQQRGVAAADLPAGPCPGSPSRGVAEEVPEPPLREAAADACAEGCGSGAPEHWMQHEPEAYTDSPTAGFLGARYFGSLPECDPEEAPSQLAEQEADVEGRAARRRSSAAQAWEQFGHEASAASGVAACAPGAEPSDPPEGLPAEPSEVPRPRQEDVAESHAGGPASGAAHAFVAPADEEFGSRVFEVPNSLSIEEDVSVEELQAARIFARLEASQQTFTLPTLATVTDLTESEEPTTSGVLALFRDPCPSDTPPSGRVFDDPGVARQEVLDILYPDPGYGSLCDDPAGAFW